VGAPLKGNVSSSSTCHDGRHRSSQSCVNNQAARWNNRWRCPVAGSPGTRERRRATKAFTLFAAPLRPFNLTSVHVLLHRGSVSRLPANWNTQHLARSRAGVSVARSELQAPSPFRNIAGSRPREVVKICNGLTETRVINHSALHISRLSIHLIYCDGAIWPYRPLSPSKSCKSCCVFVSTAAI